MACYWSIKELGALNLSCERLWFVVGLCRSETVRSLTGKMGAFTKMCLQLLQKLQFGVLVKLAATQKNIMAFGKLQILLGDEAALKDMVDFRGAAATLPCPFCRNLVDVRSNLQDHSTGAKLVPSTCLDWSLIEAHSDESIMALYEFLGEKERHLFPNGLQQGPAVVWLYLERARHSQRPQSGNTCASRLPCKRAVAH